MKEQKALEVVKDLMQQFGTVTVEKARAKNEWEIKIEKGYISQTEVEFLAELSKKHSLGYLIECSVISIWEEKV